MFVSNLEWVEGGARENDCLWLWARLGEILGRVYGVSLLASLLLPSLPFPCLPFLVPAAFSVSRKCPSITQEVPCSCVATSCLPGTAPQLAGHQTSYRDLEALGSASSDSWETI